jgi:phenylacetate-CoA ligase
VRPSTHKIRASLPDRDVSVDRNRSGNHSIERATQDNSLPRLTWDAWRATREGQDGIEARQKARLNELVSFVRARSRYLGALYKHVPAHVEDIRRIPPVTKREMMTHFDEWVTDPEVTMVGAEAFAADASRVGARFLDRYTVWTTSGSTGTPALLLQDEHALSVMGALGWARAVPAWIGRPELAGFVSRGVRGGIVFATGGHFMALTMAERARHSSSWAMALGRVISATLPTADLVRELNEIDPTLLASYASSLRLLAEEKAAERLSIDPILIVSTGETLSADARRQVQAAFSGNLRETYGASEIQIAAFECRHGRLHVNADWVILEPVDSNYEPVAAGEPSRTVLATSLSNRVQPIIRYDLGDRVTLLPDRCMCGSPLPSIRVEGRSDDILTFRSPSGEDVHVLPVAVATTIADVPGVQRSQLIGKGKDRLLVRLQTEAGSDGEAVWKAAQKSLRNLLASYGLTDIVIERSSEAPGPNPRSGKFRQVWAEPA